MKPAIAASAAFSLDAVPEAATGEARLRVALEQLQALTAALSAARTVAEVGCATLEAGRRATGAPMGVLFEAAVGGDGQPGLALVCALGYDDAAIAAWRWRPHTREMPGGDAIAYGQPVILSSRAEIAARYPALVPLLEATPRHASAVFPLAPAESASALGFVSFDFDRDRALVADEVALLATIARMCAQALERVRLAEAERAALAALARSHEEARAAAERVQLALAAGAIVGTWDWNVPADRFAIDDRFAESFGIDPALGRTGLALEQVIATVHPDDLPGLRAAIDEAFGRGGPYRHQYRVRGRDGAYRWIEANGRVDLGPDGRPLRFPGVLLDIEARRAVEAERDRATSALRAFVEAVPGVVYAKDQEGRLLVANRGTAELIGKLPEAFIGRTDVEYLDDAAQAAVIMANDRRIMENGQPEQFEEEVSLPDGTRAVWLSTKAPFRDDAGRIIGLVGSSVDITDRKRAEQTLREADAHKNEFIAMLAHELRNPLAPILNAVRLLEREQGLSPMGARGLDMIERQARHMKRLVDDLLEVNRISRGEIALRAERVELGALVLGVVEAALPAAEAKRHSLLAAVPSRPVEIMADPVRISQVLENLVANAIKYTPHGGRVRVELADDAHAIELRVVDDGIGIEPAEIERVFELFVQAQPGVGAHQGGLGIGLALVRRLVELHGGTVRAESAGRGQGARFVVRLPRRPG